MWTRWCLVLLLVTIGSPRAAAGQVGRDSLLAVARRLMVDARYAALVSVDSTGAPQARTVEPFPPEPDFTVWIGTNPRTRKVGEIRRDARVALYYYDPGAMGYVTVRGRAELVNDPALKRQWWNPGWEGFYPDREKDYLLVRVIPERLEIVSPADGIIGDAVTWRPPAVRLTPPR
ncbi:MAG TPA: pyridoxamine 5'-phosphate oxidase family protein [Gemmatimonadales bacterium]|nr:pyridoxamine 5'-phosphate oxidase family protein [Gemmatimonadales bacterium]